MLSEGNGPASQAGFKAAELSGQERGTSSPRHQLQETNPVLISSSLELDSNWIISSLVCILSNKGSDLKSGFKYATALLIRLECVSESQLREERGKSSVMSGTNRILW